MRVRIEKRDRDRDREKGTGRSLSLVSVFMLLFLTVGNSSVVEPLEVSLRPGEVSQGGVVELKASGKDMAWVKAILRNQEISFFSVEGDSYAALLGVDLEEKPGPVGITIKGLTKAGGEREKPVTLRVKERLFPRENISVPAAFDRIDEATWKRIQREQAEMARVWTISTPRRLWEGPFVAPVPGGITSPFGLRRVINGSPRSPHGGVDLKAALGAEVLAANHGQVVLREEFFFSGKSIVLDHGGGLYTMYFHLADFHLEKGSKVRKGHLIGWAGMTGRVTGPHLHWGVRLHGARVDPFGLLEAIGSK